MSRKRQIIVRSVKGYLSLAAMIAFISSVSLAKRAGWGVIWVGMPVFLTVFIGITYQLVKGLTLLKRGKQQDSE